MTKIQALFLIYFIPITAFALRPAPWVGVDFNEKPCRGVRAQGVGPFDYTNPIHRRDELPIVEKHHYSDAVDKLIQASDDSPLVSDLDYTLRAIPNHYRALLAMLRYQLKQNHKLISSERPLKSPVECYMQRAINFKPKDVGVYSRYAYYLKKIAQFKKAEEIYLKALKVAPENSKIEYSYGLLLIELKNFDKAVIYAKKAYKHGNPPAGLRNRLKILGFWK